MLTYFRFLTICCFHVNLLSIVIPRYLISVFRGIWISLMVTSGSKLFQRAKVMEQDLFSFILIRHFSDQVCRVLRWYWRSDAALQLDFNVFTFWLQQCRVLRCITWHFEEIYYLNLPGRRIRHGRNQHKAYEIIHKINKFISNLTVSF
jgi:hypothetical protein